MYKKAARLKIRFATKFGNITTEQLWDLKMSQLKEIVISANEEIKKLKKVDDDLSFLEDGAIEDTETEIAKLKFDILKDVYTTRLNEKKEASENAKIDRDIRHLEEILAEKEEQDLRNKSPEELRKMIEERKAGKK